MGDGHHLHPHDGGLRLFGGRNRPLFAPRGWLVEAEAPGNRPSPAGIAAGSVAQEAEEQGADPLGPGIAVYQHRLGVIPEGPQAGTLDELTWRLS